MSPPRSPGPSAVGILAVRAQFQGVLLLQKVARRRAAYVNADPRVERRAERVVAGQRLEVGVAAGQRPVLRVERNGPLEMGDSLRQFAPLRVCDGNHVERVVVVRVLVAHQPQMGEGLVVAAAVDGQRRGVEPLVDGLRSRILRRRLPGADVQVEADAFVQFLLFRVEPQDRLEQRRGAPIVVFLDRSQPTFVQGDRLDVGGAPLGRGRGRGGGSSVRLLATTGCRLAFWLRLRPLLRHQAPACRERERVFARNARVR